MTQFIAMPRILAAVGLAVSLALSAGLEAASLSRWTTYQGTPNHHGFVDTATRLPESRAPRWWRQLVPQTLPGGGTYIGLAIADGRLYVTPPQRYVAINPVAAVDIRDGSPIWERNYPGVFNVNPPAVSASGHVRMSHG